ncbi:hypothetical protein KMW40_05935 [Enterobacter cloacae]|uniref:phage tail fiber domain-containing protein n=1 Tax=Enterobacter cloacae TaxID=550 RepID=UPI0034A3FB24
MSVPNQTPYIIYNANGLTTVFPFEFYIINAGDIQVSLNGEVITSGYSVTGVGNVGGGDVTFLTPPANGTVVMLERVVPTYRLTDYQDNGDLLADTVNKDFDRLWMAIQRSFIYLGLALRRPLLGGPYDAEGYRIAGLADPVDNQDAATKNYVENVALRRTLRVSSGFIDPLPPIDQLEGKVVGFAGGRPVAVSVPSGSAADVFLQLADPDKGVNLVSGAVKNVPYFSSLKNGHHGLAEVVMTVEHHAGGLGGASYRRSGTVGTPSSGDEALVYDADGIGWKMVKQPVQSARAFGLLGDGVDDRAAIQLAADFVGQNGGGVLYVESLNGFNDVELGDSLTITFSGVEIKLGDEIHVHTETATPNKGYCIGFSGSLTSESGRIKRVGISGGSVSANGSGNLDNAIGFAGCEDFYAEDIYIPNADRKAVTAQVNVVNGRFKKIRVGTTGYDAISIEGDTLNHAIRTRNFVLEDITIESAGRDGVNCSGDSETEHTDQVILKNIRVNSAVRNGMTFTQCDNVYIDHDSRVNNCGGYGISFASCLEVSGGAQILNTQSAALVPVSCNRFAFDARITNAGLSGAGINDAIYINAPLSPHFIKAIVYGTSHRYLFNNASSLNGHVITFPSHDYMPPGTAGLFAGTVATVKVDAPSMPTFTAAANPNVLSYDSFLLSPASAFTMTTMNGALPGKVVTVQFNGSVTVAHGTVPGTIRLKGSTNVTPAAGSVMMFSYTSEGLWREASRNF